MDLVEVGGSARIAKRTWSLQVRLDAQQEQLQSMGALVETLSAGRPVNMFFAKNVKWCVDLCVRVASDMCVVVLVHS